LTEPTPEAFAEGLGALLSDPDRRRQMGETGRRFVERERSLDAFRERLREGLSRLGLV
jgi:glycosyltransferase involved in cell wall biosynthesis